MDYIYIYYYIYIYIYLAIYIYIYMCVCVSCLNQDIGVHALAVDGCSRDINPRELGENPHDYMVTHWLLLFNPETRLC